MILKRISSKILLISTFLRRIESVFNYIGLDKLKLIVLNSFLDYFEHIFVSKDRIVEIKYLNKGYANNYFSPKHFFVGYNNLRNA